LCGIVGTVCPEPVPVIDKAQSPSLIVFAMNEAMCFYASSSTIFKFNPVSVQAVKMGLFLRYQH
jgi:hypothetical protein